MTKITKLSKYKEENIFSGSILRFSGKFPYENTVDMMFFLTSEIDHPLGLIVTTGYRSGRIYRKFSRSLLALDGHAISTSWIRENWHKVYPDCDLSDVYILDEYPPPVID